MSEEKPFKRTKDCAISGMRNGKVLICLRCMHDAEIVAGEVFYEPIFNSEVTGKEKCSLCRKKLVYE